jgi:Ulp1 family protease
MPGTFPLPSPPTTPTMIVLDSDSDDDKEDDNDDNDSKKAINEENQIIFTTTNKISLTDRDLQTLQPGKWLNDTIVDFSLKIIQDRNKYSDYSFVSSSFFFTRLRLAKE